MKRRQFLKGAVATVTAALVGSKVLATKPEPTITPTMAGFTNRQITSGDDLVVGQIYRLVDRRTDEWSYSTCKRDGCIYFNERMWASVDNPQAFMHWDIYETKLTDTSYNEMGENLAIRQQWADAHKRTAARMKAAQREYDRPIYYGESLVSV